MRVAIYARVSTTRQAQAQTIEQQLDRLRAAVAERGWRLDEQHSYRDDGYSGAGLGRPGLDRLRDQAALAELDLVVVSAPDRLARTLRPPGAAAGRARPARLEGGVLGPADEPGPHDQLLLQIRGAVADYERTLIAERMRRGGRPSYGQARCCPGPRRRSATGWTPNGPGRWPGCGWSPVRRCWSPSCSTVPAAPGDRGPAGQAVD
jgi:hypothetical protein